MLGLTPSELGIVIFLLLVVVGAAKLPRWGERLGVFLHRRLGRRRDAKSEVDQAGR